MQKVSVIIPNYNHAKYLNQRIDSVLDQTYDNFKVIILDDCSSDNSRDVIESYRKHPKVSHIVYNQTNSGSAFLQWKRGIELAEEDWIWIAESDDFSDPALLETLVKGIQHCPVTVLSYCQSYEVDENGTIIRDLLFHTSPLSSSHWNNDFCNQGVDEIREYLLFRNTIPNASAVLFSKKAYMNADKGFVNMKYCGDWLLWSEILKSGNICYSKKPLNYFRRHAFTTRVLSDKEKRKVRLEEEYIIVHNIKLHFGNISRKDFDRRFKEIYRDYSSNISVKEIFYYLILYKMYTSPIPLSKVMRHIFIRSINWFKRKIGFASRIIFSLL